MTFVCITNFCKVIIKFRLCVTFMNNNHNSNKYEYQVFQCVCVCQRNVFQLEEYVYIII